MNGRIQFGQEFGGAPIVFLHGFPGLRSKQNRVIAEEVSKRTRRPTLILLYAGLGFESGEFSFYTCASEVEQDLKDIQKQNGGAPLDLVGHSWGGFMSLKVIGDGAVQVAKLGLMSPLLKFFTAETAQRSFAQTALASEELSLGRIADRSREFAELGDKYPLKKIASRIPETTDVLFLQASVDEITPGSIAEETLGYFRAHVDYRVIETDHSFLTNREPVIEAFAKFFSRTY